MWRVGGAGPGRDRAAPEPRATSTGSQRRQAVRVTGRCATGSLLRFRKDGFSALALKYRPGSLGVASGQGCTVDQMKAWWLLF